MIAVHPPSAPTTSVRVARDDGIARRPARPTARERAGDARRRHAVGVDVGGTWLRVLAEDPRGRRRAHREPAPSRETLPARLRGLWRRWKLAPPDVAVLVVAARGVWTNAERRAARRRLGGLARRIHPLSDVEAAYLGALGDRPGILLLAGTGSIALGRNAGGRWARAGGLGPLKGDEGSAFWIGRAWLTRRSTQSVPTEPSGRAHMARRSPRAPDRTQSAPPLASDTSAVARIAALAPRVLEAAHAGSPGARRIVAEARRHLATLLSDVARDLRLRAPIAVSWAGGLLADARLRRGIWAEGRAHGLVLSPRAPSGDGAEAALAIARRMLSGFAPTAGAGGRRPRRPLSRPVSRRR
jgi:N-acetylglucosamine kinase-like BadF-type ATPase